ncbi:type I DNA topoisomerase [Psychrosphaera sp. B3R10]|uniref:type I DNA topoisomerase n=1 Tax=unclassified Psychrosphaera TaxID=2641570 RepID=UPI001C0918F3|nr:MULTISPECIES: type I DNA topoisomerase [unclassified Psychrosphaera]MBU2883997.1 type I DNA topoisomerase [Psychrosphaera sp. I2R16]MBU2988127.1 type I DNA topoisomerase [Psychrosphaera sp. B3R10]MDO6721546.1 type I DNA topoisomerase [Psychrosphaera sp. 1_MG-2023]
MGKSLVIVESPAKAKTINKYLGKDFVVKSSVGHIRDLPTSGGAKKPAERASTKGLSVEEKAKLKAKKDKEALVGRMGINPEKGWAANYQVLPGKEKVVAELKKLAANADQIYLATDLDREGEAIAWHLREIIGGDDSKFKRVVFNEITKSAIQQAFSKPGELNIDCVNAQQARRFLDRVVGFMVSPLLWKKIARGLSAGRVQSVAVRLVVDREREIKAFVPEEFWRLHADTATAEKQPIMLEVAKQSGKAFKPTNKAQMDTILAAIKAQTYTVVNREDKPSKSRPSAPFITSTLQQAASTRLGFGVKKTMMMAQRLYEAGHITYMRTDSTNLSSEAVGACRMYIQSEFGDKYLPEKPNLYGSKEGAQEAHEAIRPSSVGVDAEQLASMERDAVRLYDLIRNQFLACQMTAAEYDVTNLTVNAGEFELRAKGRVLKFDGWTRVQSAMKKANDDNIELPNVAVGETLTLNELLPKQHFTKPIARFSEASLVKELEKRGIGRPSTYASIISTIQDRGYVRLENKRFYAEKMGEIVTDRLVENFTELLNYDFTAKMEGRLDEVAEGDLEWKRLLDIFYEDFTKKLATAAGESDDGGMRENTPVPTDIECSKCGRDMNIRTASTGVFLGCSGYALPPKERCTNTMNLTHGDEAEAVNVSDEEELETEVLRQMKRCPKCSTAMDSYLIDEKRKIHICGNNPICDGHVVEQGEFKIKGYDGPLIECDKCGSDMQLKSGRFGKYFGCTGEECKNTRKLLKSGEAAPPKEDPVHLKELPCTKSDGYFVLRDGASGIFMAASTFPKSRETRAPLVAELKKYRDRISPKFYYLADAPVKDPDGNKTVVRFSRKTKQQYVMTENAEGKATGWSAWYTDDKWQVEDKRKKK